MHKSAFFTNFTFRAPLKHNYCVSLTFCVRNWSEILGFNQKRADFSKITCFCKICVVESQMSRFTCSAVHNPHFRFLYFTENASQCIIFSITEHIFYPAHVVLIPQAPFLTCVLVHKYAFFYEFYVPHAPGTTVQCFPNVLGPKLVRNCRFHSKTRGFFKNPLFLQNMRRGIPNVTFHAFCCP